MFPLVFLIDDALPGDILGILTFLNADTGSTDLVCVEGAMETFSHLAAKSNVLMGEGCDWCDR